MKHWPIILTSIAVGFCCRLSVAAPPGPIRFERDIQPLLTRCLACHGTDKARAGLRLDNRLAALSALESGNRAIVPTNPAQSELLRRICSTDSAERMPPKGDRLSADQAKLIERWIAEGAVWPAHWAYRPLVKPLAPVTTRRDWARGPIDQFILTTLSEHNLAPAPDADRRTLLRRVTLDLTGLPPSPDEQMAFLADSSPFAYERLVDRLLSSPRYGERWARHWMDVVHFAETHGNDQDRPREHAWPYRDYLIRAFNENKPFARFVQEQVAGDALFPDDPWATVGTGFLAAGPWDESSLRDIREDSVDREIGRYLDRDDIVTNVMGTFSSTTAQCARCHDHKFDPISQKEYYGLQAVFASTDKANRSFDPDPQIARKRRELQRLRVSLRDSDAEVGALRSDPATQREFDAWERRQLDARRRWQILEPSSIRSTSGSTLVRLSDGSVLATGVRPDTDTYSFVTHLEPGPVTAIRLELLPDGSLPSRGPGRQDNGNLHLNEFSVLAASPETGKRELSWSLVQADFNQEGWPVANATDRNPKTAWGIFPQIARAHQAIFTLAQPIANGAGTTLVISLRQSHGMGHVIGRFRLAVADTAEAGAVDPLPQDLAAILQIAPDRRTAEQQRMLATHFLRQRVESEWARLPAPSQVYCGTSHFVPEGSFRPASTPRDVYRLVRGDIHNRAEAVQPGALSYLDGVKFTLAPAGAASESARRAALARWLSDPDNGLTWRSMANRVWQFHFGRGLVDTPNDFGRMGSPPTHPELLEWLAATLRETGSIKNLDRLIVTSAVYRQSSRHEARFAETDGDNRYLWRMNRSRLDAESLHDSLLVISNRLDSRMGGPSVKQFIQTPGIHVTPNVDYANFDVDDPANDRRSVYRFLFRTLPDPLMETLDCPDGSQSAPVRGASVTALQALALLNDKFVVRQCDHIATCILAGSSTLPQQAGAAVQLILGRAATARELHAVSNYIARNGLANACRILINSSEFVFVD